MTEKTFTGNKSHYFLQNRNTCIRDCDKIWGRNKKN